MKNTLIPLDMLWLDPEGRVVSIARSVPPCKPDPCPSYPPTADALYVVELVAGFARQHSVKVGDALRLEGVPKIAAVAWTTRAVGPRRALPLLRRRSTRSRC